ncbi:hypothetical protein DFH08DRAFT_1027754 [Mycena albidolilacea]|uniref:Uncharacterized protein n=1 Tax=Mycena albidolilacea TaxID=1033008 RepID=A0AAD7EHI4_9AGAR|nr:hypothetical protein DFH08DRAFT_1027754 [Mycena albidolilacea]
MSSIPVGTTTTPTIASRSELKSLIVPVVLSWDPESAQRAQELRWVLVWDMTRSGELAKYGFAVVNHLNVISQVAASYNIGSKFGKMVNAHSVLGPLAQEKGFKSLVGTFHGNAHSRLCQLCHLATSVEGYTTAFHHQQTIVFYLKHTDGLDTYQSLSLLLVTKYRQVLEHVSVFEEWLRLEKACLDGLSTEPLEETLKIEYYQKLVNLDKAEARLSALRGAVAHEDSSQQGYQQNTSVPHQLETQRQHAMELRDKILLTVQDLEMRMDLRDRWTPGCAEWSEAAP